MVRPMQVRAVDVGAGVIMTGMDDVRTSRAVAGHLKQRGALTSASIIGVKRGGGRHHERQTDKANQGENRAPPSRCYRLQEGFQQGARGAGVAQKRKRMTSRWRPTQGMRRSATQGRGSPPWASCC